MAALERTDLGSDAWFDYDAQWMPADEADGLFATLRDELDWEQRPITVFGKEVMQPRLIAWAGEHPYRYSGQTLPTAPYPPTLKALVDRVSDIVGVPFNHVLLNRYRNGRDNMGMHADDEWELGKDPVIAALSLGAMRRFTIVKKGKGKKRRRTNLPLENGSLLVMGGTMQHRFYHGLPRVGGDVGERINVTFRMLLGPPGCRPKHPARGVDLAPSKG